MDCYRKIFRIGKVKKNYIYVCVFSHRRNAFGKSTKKQWEMSENSTPSGGEIKTGVERAREIERERETARIQISEGKLLPFTGIIWDFQSDVIAEYVGCARRNRRSAMAVQLTTENTEVAPCLSLDPSHDPAHYGPTDILEVVC